MTPLARSFIKQLQSKQPIRHRMKWTGSKIPRGATIGGVEIGWTQHGIITGILGEELGYYERTKEWAGPNGDQHEMIVAVKAKAVGPDGRACELLLEVK